MENSEIRVLRPISASMTRWLISGLLLSGILLASSCARSVNSELARNEKLWQSQNIASYDFTLSRQCFCPEEWRGPVNIQVRNGMATSVTYVTNGQTAAAEIFGNVDTIGELFGVLHDAYEGKNSFNQKAARVDVTYHPQLGYPLTIYIDVSEMIADEEQGYAVENLVGR